MCLFQKYSDPKPDLSDYIWPCGDLCVNHFFASWSAPSPWLIHTSSLMVPSIAKSMVRIIAEICRNVFQDKSILQHNTIKHIILLLSKKIFAAKYACSSLLPFRTSIPFEANLLSFVMILH